MEARSAMEAKKKSNWIPIYRKLIDWEWYQSSNMVHLWIHLLLKANISNTKWRGIEIGRGQLITGRLQLFRETGIKETSIKNCLKNLQKSGEITITSTNRFSIITICNYDIYQFSGKYNDQQNNQQDDHELNSDLTDFDQQKTTSNKKEKKIKKEINKVQNAVLDAENTGYIKFLIREFKKIYEEFNGTEYETTNIEAEKNAAKEILRLLKKYQSNEFPLNHESIKEFLIACINIDDPWIHDNMSLPLIVSKFNQIKINLKNGKSRKKRTGGATEQQIADIVCHKFNSDC